MYLGLQVKCPFLVDFNQIWTSAFIKAPNIKFQSSLNRADTCGQTDGHDEDIRRFSRLYERA